MMNAKHHHLKSYVPKHLVTSVLIVAILKNMQFLLPPKLEGVQFQSENPMRYIVQDFDHIFQNDIFAEHYKMVALKPCFPTLYLDHDELQKVFQNRKKKGKHQQKNIITATYVSTVADKTRCCPQ